jgi:hypothetical protein
MSAVVLSHTFPNVWDWTWWSAKTMCQGTYWLVYGRFEDARKEQRLRQVFQEEIDKAIAELTQDTRQQRKIFETDLQNMQLAVGGTDLILVRQQ